MNTQALFYPDVALPTRPDAWPTSVLEALKGARNYVALGPAFPYLCLFLDPPAWLTSLRRSWREKEMPVVGDLISSEYAKVGGKIVKAIDDALKASLPHTRYVELLNKQGVCGWFAVMSTAKNLKAQGCDEDLENLMAGRYPIDIEAFFTKIGMSYAAYRLGFADHLITIAQNHDDNQEKTYDEA